MKAAPARDNLETAVHAELELEADRLIAAARRGGPREAIMRLRALSQMAELLSTRGLIELAAAVEVTRQSVAPKASGVARRGLRRYSGARTDPCGSA